MTLSAGEVAVFNFDFEAAGASPPPPYTSVHLDLGLVISSLQFGELWEATLHSNLDAQGLSLAGVGINTSALGTISPLVLDGEFSWRIEMISGSISFDPFAWAFEGTIRTANIDPLSPTQVPEAATLFLIGIGLAGLAFRRRKRT